MIEGIFVEGLVYGIMVLGVFITFRILSFPDLTVDGSFPLGAAIMAIMLTRGSNPWLALMLALAGGMLAGFVTALIHTKLKVPNLLAGILTMTMLWSINIRVLGNRANLTLVRRSTILSDVVQQLSPYMNSQVATLLFFLVVALVVKVLLDVFFHTDLGLTLGAMGNNEQMVINQGVNPEHMKLIGVGLSNGLVALSGAFVAQFQGFADVNLGQGIIVAGLASVMMGEFILRSNKIAMLTLRVLLGSILYRGLMYLGRYYGYYINLTPSDLRLITGLLIVVSLIVTQVRGERKWSGAGAAPLNGGEPKPGAAGTAPDAEEAAVSRGPA
ncbi:MAG: ABC transporter permease [Spirochaetaceae bacterium]|nr:MAG: ABC transporter permease [Spirochaetaceae bacterium]